MGIMLNRFLSYRTVCTVSFLVAIGVCVFVPASQVHAQQCQAPFEMLTKLHHPEPGSFTVWSAVYGEPRKEEEFISIVSKGEGVLVAGEMRPMPGVSPSLMLVHFDRRGRKVWDVYYALGGLKNVIKLLPHKDGYVVFANRKKVGGQENVWIGFFDQEGKLKSHKSVKDKKFHLHATDVVRSTDGGWAVSMTVERLGHVGAGGLQKYAAIYLLDDMGAERASRAYVLGTNNEILSLSVSKFDGDQRGYIATGYFEIGGGQKVGWVVRLSDEISLVWQREFRRGKLAKLEKGVGYKNKDIIVLGDVDPVIKGPTGGWLMRLDGDNGAIKWQRYYYGETGHHDYEAQGLYVNDDGLITSMMMARSSKGKEASSIMVGDAEGQGGDDGALEYMSYAHVLTLSPRGITLNGDSYYHGEGVSVSQMIEGHKGYRMMAGYSLMPAEDIFTKMEKKHHDNPLKEEGDVNLPDAPLSSKTKKGLAMLKKKIKHQDHHDEGEQVDGQEVESAKHHDEDVGLTRNGWVFLGDSPDTYSDPCAKK